MKRVRQALIVAIAAGVVCALIFWVLLAVALVSRPGFANWTPAILNEFIEALCGFAALTSLTPLIIAFAAWRYFVTKAEWRKANRM